LKRKLTRSRVLGIAIAVVASVVAVLLILIGVGVLRLPGAAAPQVTVAAVEWNILQGKTQFGFGWFGNNSRNMTDVDGLPVTVASGHTFALSLTLSNLDHVNHSLYSVVASSPFAVSGVLPALPVNVVSGSDDFVMTVTVTAPTVSSDTTYSLILTINAIPP